MSTDERADEIEWIPDIGPTYRDPRLVALRAALDEFRSAKLGAFLRGPITIDGSAYVIIGTWRGVEDDQPAYINGAPGSAKSFQGATDLVELEEGDETHRVWLLRHRVGLPLKLWRHVGGRDVGRGYLVLGESGWRGVTEAEYLAARRAWS